MTYWTARIAIFPNYHTNEQKLFPSLVYLARQTSRSHWKWRTLRDMHWMAERITATQSSRGVNGVQSCPGTTESHQVPRLPRKAAAASTASKAAASTAWKRQVDRDRYRETSWDNDKDKLIETSWHREVGRREADGGRRMSNKKLEPT